MLARFAPIAALCCLSAFAPLSEANAVTVSASYQYSGDICDDFDADGGPSGTDFNDCNEIVQNGGPIGRYEMALTGLRSDIVSDATFSLSVRRADLFAVGGGNNPVERFDFGIDSLYFGTLFDDSTADEAARSVSLAASVAQNIATSTRSDGPISLAWTVAAAEMTPLLADGALLGYFNFYGDVASMRDINFSVNYAAVPLPAGGVLLLGALGGLLLLRRKSQAY